MKPNDISTLTSRLPQAETWLKQARRDRSVVERILCSRRPEHLPETPEIAVYLLQQAVEKACKSLMVARGEDQSKFGREPGHNSLKAILEFLKPMFRIDVIGQTLDLLAKNPDMGMPDATGARSAFNDVLRMAGEKEFRSVAAISDNEMRPFIQIMSFLHQEVESVTRRSLPSRLRVPVPLNQLPRTPPTDFIWDYVNSLFKEPPSLSDEYIAAAKNLYAPIAPQLVRELTTGYEAETLNRDKLLSNLILPQICVLPSLYILAALTYPHEASSRYPAPYSAPTDPKEAAERRMLGTQHYTEDLGIVKLLSELNDRARFVLDNMNPLLEMVADNSVEPFPP